MSLRARAISGVKWAGGAQILRNILAIIAMVILARLLSPVDFGLMGMAVVVIARCLGLTFSVRRTWQ